MYKKYFSAIIFLLLFVLLSGSVSGNSLEGGSKNKNAPGFVSPEEVLGQRFFSEGKYEEAAKMFEIAADKGGLSGRGEALWGVSCYRSGNKEKAGKILSSAAQTYPEEPLVYVGLGYLSFDDHDYKKSLEYFQKADSLSPGLPEAVKGMVAVYINQGVQEYGRGDADKAEELFKKALQVKPDSVEAFTNIAILKQEEGRLDEAVSLYKKALSYKRGDAKILKLLVQALKEKDGLGGTELFDTVVRLAKSNSFDPYSFELLGRIYEKKGEKTDTLDAFSKAFDRGSEDPYVYLRLAESDYAEGKSKDALSLLYLAVGKAVHRIGLIQTGAARKVNGMKGNMNKDDLQELKKYSDLLSEPRDILNSAVSLLRRIRGSDSLFEEDMKKLSSWYPHSADIRAAYGKILEDEGKWEQALFVWTDIAESHPYNYSAHVSLARIYRARGNRRKALFECKKSIDIDSKNREAYDLLFELYSDTKNTAGLVAFLEDRYEMDSYNETLVSMMIKVYEFAGNNEKALRMKEWLKHLREY